MRPLARSTMLSLSAYFTATVACLHGSYLLFLKKGRGTTRSRLFFLYDKGEQPASNSYAAIGIFKKVRQQQSTTKRTTREGGAPRSRSAVARDSCAGYAEEAVKAHHEAHGNK
jgi:hypothetical protein